MNRYFLYLIIILSSSLTVLAQNGAGSGSDPVSKIEWKDYKIGSQKISISMPKLPVTIDNDNPCREFRRRSYYAYAEDIVYSLTITVKSKDKPPSYCEKKENFSVQIFNERLEELKQTAKLDESAKLSSQNREVTILRSNIEDYRIYDDLKNNRWIELTTFHRLNKKIDAQNFIDSLKFDAGQIGVEIGDGSPITIGDGIVKNSDVKNDSPGSANQENTAEPLNIAAKPRPSYTDAARQKNVQGDAVLRVTFLADGGIGTITPVNGLPSGLTEQAIAAARKIVFLPAKKNGMSVSITKQVQYSFRIY